MGKHAYLLEVHHRKDLIEELLKALDDERNDIFMHIDKNAEDIDFDMFHTLKANLYEVPSMEVYWGGYSQIKLIMHLLEEATNKDNYDYYHLMQGSAYPLKSQDELHDFYDKHQGIEFITIDKYVPEERIRYFWLYSDSKEFSNLSEKNKFKNTLMHGFKKLQMIFKYDRLKNYNIIPKKGFALWSITDSLARYVLDNKKLIEELFHNTYCGDEFFLQTIAYNSKFKDKINYVDEDIASSLWLSTWYFEDKGIKREGHNFKLEDLDYLLNTDASFARKFEGEDGLKIIEVLEKKINNK